MFFQSRANHSNGLRLGAHGLRRRLGTWALGPGRTTAYRSLPCPGANVRQPVNTPCSSLRFRCLSAAGTGGCARRRRADARKRGLHPFAARLASAACLRREQGAALGAGEVTLESEVFTGASAGARVDARRTCQEPRLTDHARRHGSDLAFDLSIIASLDGSRSQPPVPAAEDPVMRDAAALLKADRTCNVHLRPHRDARLRRAGRDRSADLRVTRWAKVESETGAV